MMYVFGGSKSIRETNDLSIRRNNSGKGANNEKRYNVHFTFRNGYHKEFPHSRIRIAVDEDENRLYFFDDAKGNAIDVRENAGYISFGGRCDVDFTDKLNIYGNYSINYDKRSKAFYVDLGGNDGR